MLERIIKNRHERYRTMQITGGTRPFTATIQTQARLSETYDGIPTVDVRNLRQAIALKIMLRRFGSLTAEGKEVKEVSWSSCKVPDGRNIECNIHILNRRRAENEDDTCVRATFKSRECHAALNYYQATRAGLELGDFTINGGLFFLDDPIMGHGTP